MHIKQKLILAVFIFGLVFSFAPRFFVLAKSEGDREIFFVEKLYDQNQRSQVEFRLVKISNNAYFYVESNWYLTITDQERGLINQNLAILASSFDKEIYPKLTNFWGSEWNPGIDSDSKITVVFEQLNKGVAGYFNDANEYLKQQSPFSNQREMVFLSTDVLKSSLAESYLAHEFTHLITFNQKDRLTGTSEDVWLNEARAEYSPFYLGYDGQQNQYSNLQQRVNDFSNKPSDSLVIWNGEESDYGVVDIFIQYLVEKYGQNILVSSLHSKKTGVDSIDEALLSRGEGKSFLQIFNDWATAVFLNDCSLGDVYYYKSKELMNLRLPANLIVLPSIGKTNLSLNYSLMPWSSNWYKFIGSEGDLKLTFNFDSKALFALKYVLCEIKDGCSVFGFDVSDSKKELVINNFSQHYLSLTLIPSVKPRFSNAAGLGDVYSFSVVAQTSNEPSKFQEEELIKSLLAQIEQLKIQIAKVQAQLLAMGKTNLVCSGFQTNLYFGLSSSQVSCLQEFLKNQGPDIYPQGIVSGYFGNLTKTAVINFQEKYGIASTGYVGVLTRAKINQMLLPTQQK
ncbi:MAG: peptidoglycan-binding domain-containing protein [Candidatus Pacebacteria bacterium]|nr:peptidoglycan-binding domain-containing protein [Candidatus Paceibacterota bacterium]